MSETELKVGPWFPRAPKECKKVADIFFTCFTAESQQPLKGVS